MNNRANQYGFVAMVIASASVSALAHPMSIVSGAVSIEGDALVVSLQLDGHTLEHLLTSDRDAGCDEVVERLAQSIVVIGEESGIRGGRVASNGNAVNEIEIHFAMAAADQAAALRYEPHGLVAPPQQIQLAIAGAAGQVLHLTARGNTQFVNVARAEDGSLDGLAVSDFGEPVIRAFEGAAGSLQSIHIEYPWMTLNTWREFELKSNEAAEAMPLLLKQYESWSRMNLTLLREGGGASEAPRGRAVFVESRGAEISPDQAAERHPVFRRLRSVVTGATIGTINGLAWGGFNQAAMRLRVVVVQDDGSEVEVAELNPSEAEVWFEFGSAADTGN